MPKKHKYEDIKQYFEDQGCQLLDLVYPGTNKILDKLNITMEERQDFQAISNGVKCEEIGSD